MTMIDAEQLKEDIEYQCLTNGSEEALKWNEWFQSVIDAEIRMQEKREIQMKEVINYLTKDIPTWKLVLMDKWTDIKVWVWCKVHRVGKG